MAATKKDSLYLAIDQGGHASRAIVFDRTGKIITQAESAITTATPQTDWVEHDPDEVVASIHTAIAAVIQQLGKQRQHLKAAGLATQRSSIVCWDKNDGRALSPVLSWQDRRQHQWLTQFAERHDIIHEKTGLFLSPHYGASKLRWCLDHLPEVAEAQQQGRLTAGPLASYLAFKLLEEQPLCADPANASRTLLWNIHDNNWDAELCQMFGVPEEILPVCTRSREAFGSLAIAGLSPGLPLTVMTGDQSAALFAWGWPEQKNLYINIGTGAFIQRPVGQRHSHHHLLTGAAYLDSQQQCYTLEGTVNGAARALQWFSQEHSIGDLRTQLPDWLERCDQPPLFINGISGLGSPDWVPSLKSEFVGGGSAETQAVAIIESIVFLISRNITAMEEALPPAEQIIVSGGLANLDGLCQRLADMTNTPVIRPEATEATASGLAWLVAGQPQGWRLQPDKDNFTPKPAPGLKQRNMEWQRQLKQAISAAICP